MEHEELTGQVIGCAIEVHRVLGPGVLESTYEQCLCYELTQSGIAVKNQAALPVDYKSVRLDCGYRVDLLVNDQWICELKSVDRVLGIHEAPLSTCMKLVKKTLGLVIHFNVECLKDRITRYVLQGVPRNLCVLCGEKHNTGYHKRVERIAESATAHPKRSRPSEQQGGRRAW
ncbi:MAG: GxxExxY protein [Phycisphaerae bacterium]|nr:GxxExxY protein [Phycisphaerae bacterium]